jgi:hypothetical protein
VVGNGNKQLLRDVYPLDVHRTEKQYDFSISQHTYFSARARHDERKLVMASGQQIAEQNFKTFATWVASKTDDDFRGLVNRGVLCRKEISIECGFAKSALVQNPRIKAALCELEDALRERGVLPPFVEKLADETAKPLMREPGKLQGARAAAREQRYQAEIASLKAELSEVKRLLEELTIIREALALTGRVPR